MNNNPFFIGKNILIISPESWNEIFVSKHHYALELSLRGNKVFFLNPPTPNKKLEINKNRDFPNLFIINYSLSFKGQRFLPGFLRRAFDRNVLNNIERDAMCKIDVVWNFENSRFYDLDFAGSKVLKIYHQVDLNQDFHVNTAAQTADICFCTSDFILQKLIINNQNSFKIHHGFSKSLNENKQSGVKDKRVNPVAILIGNLNLRYLDINLLAEIIKQNADVHFKLIGPYSSSGKAYLDLKRLPNVKFEGKMRAFEISVLLKQADILLVIYKEEAKEQVSSPHKLMEYFGSGKVIVATYTDEYKDKRHLLAMADKWEEYPSLFRKVKTNLEVFNAEERQMERIQFAKENSYNRQIEKIERLIEKYVAKK